MSEQLVTTSLQSLEDAVQRVLDIGVTRVGDGDAVSALANSMALARATPGLAGLEGQGLEAINAVLSDTNVVDLFLYDTSQDSDGGAWRLRCQDTSWYNEPLGTATRGLRREFPAVALIVAENSRIVIYDATDPALPMWMVFAQGFERGMHPASPQLVMLNARLAAGGRTYDVNCFDFLGDRIGNSFNFRKFNGNISQRNMNMSYGASGSAPWFLTQGIVSRTVNDVAMTVLPDAPIDPDTGLPVPTIAVATDGGVSFIKDDGTVWSTSFSHPYGGQQHIGFSENSDLFVSARYAGGGSLNTWTKGPSGFAVKKGGSHCYLTAIDVRNETFVNLLSDEHRWDSTVSFIGGNSGAMSFVEIKEDDPQGSMVSQLSTGFATGWMVGSIKGAWLADTDDTDLVNSGELVGNSTFDVDLTGYVASTVFPPASITWDGPGAMTVVGSGNSYSGVHYAITCEVGVTYNVVAEMTGSGYVSSSASGGGWAPTSHITSFVATNTLMYVVAATSGANSVTFHKISVQRADEDRSVSKNHLTVHGTITRAPVAAGAELVGYSGFTANNNLVQPYNPDLDFLQDASNDYSVMWWGIPTDTGWSPVAGLDHYEANKKLWWGLISSRPCFGGIYIGGPIGLNSLHQICLVNRGGIVEAYVDGAYHGEAALTANEVAAPETQMAVGGRNGNSGTGVRDAGRWSQLSLLRISATAPTAEQIRKIYQDEKALFEPGAQCTLPGSAVRDLAFNPTTGLLNAVTDGGGAVFDGLRRIETNAYTSRVEAKGDYEIWM